MTDITIPPAALEAMRAALAKGKPVREVASALLEAWPGMERDRVIGVKADSVLILPLTEKTDDKA